MGYHAVDKVVSESINGGVARSSTGREGKDAFGVRIMPERIERFFHNGRGPT